MMTMTTFDPSGSEKEDCFDENEAEEICDAEEIEYEIETEELAKEESIEGVTLDSLYSNEFDMQAVIAEIPDVVGQIDKVISEDKSDVASIKDFNFESLCMDLIEKIVAINKHWTRKDAIQEAAKELLVVRKEFQRSLAEKVHKRVLREFLIATDNEYLLLRRQIWGE